MKTVILVGDGMGDLPIAELGGKTPLEYVDTPAIDFVSRNGELSLLRTVPEGYPPGSDVANLSLLGYDPEDVYSGRAPLEAARSLSVATWLPWKRLVTVKLPWLITAAAISPRLKPTSLSMPSRKNLEVTFLLSIPG